MTMSRADQRVRQQPGVAERGLRRQSERVPARPEHASRHARAWSRDAGRAPPSVSDLSGSRHRLQRAGQPAVHVSRFADSAGLARVVPEARPGRLHHRRTGSASGATRTTTRSTTPRRKSARRTPAPVAAMSARRSTAPTSSSTATRRCGDNRLRYTAGVRRVQTDQTIGGRVSIPDPRNVALACTAGHRRFADGASLSEHRQLRRRPTTPTTTGCRRSRSRST